MKCFDLILLDIFTKEFTISKISYLVYVEYAHIENKRQKIKPICNSLGIKGSYLVIWDLEKIDKDYNLKKLGGKNGKGIKGAFRALGRYCRKISRS